MKKVSVLGSLNMDLVTRVHKTPVVGETVLGEGFVQIPGGKGANQAATIGRLGGNVSMIGRVGEDEFGKQLMESLNHDHVDTKYVLKSKSAPTGTALIMVNESGDNSIVVIPGANFELSTQDVSEQILEGDYLVAQLEVPLEIIEKSFEMAKQKGITTVLNPAPAKALSPSILRHVDILIPNETEFKLLTGCDPKNEDMLDQGVSDLIALGTKKILITLGERGAVLCDGVTKTYFKAQKVAPVDTTAAGDSFIGGLLFALSKGESLDRSINFGTLVAAITVTRAGAQSSLPTWAEVVEKFGV
ncbi:ribokinase [Fusibacter ferrireducens]|uniref:Ribokinase n=1 Tax=Fusibacter ferrireducens TaxID=2785058 RepID=A0ABR9ZWW6_9FIRM|nr:ribokinase [Fusibacter ferrireducens]MBF4694963.1 ribokinase [Fusibacter ferrireducens]